MPISSRDDYFWISLSCSISEISLTVAEEGRPSEDSEKARQIEKCDCPTGYSGLSCEVRAPTSVSTRVLGRRCDHTQLVNQSAVFLNNKVTIESKTRFKERKLLSKSPDIFLN